VARVRLIDENAQQIGTINFWDALKAAQDKGMDLVEIAPQSDPPVCKLMDYNKFLFEEKKKEKEQRKKERASQVILKDIQINPVIQEGDLNIKIKNIHRILNEGDKVRVVVKFTGRQMKHVELAKTIFEKIIDRIPDAVLEKNTDWEGRNIFIILTKK
jgi:translation initiation factor IF-3